MTGRRRRLKRSAGELAYEALDRASLVGGRADRLAQRQEPRRVLVAGVYRPDSLLPEALAALGSSRHQVSFALGATGLAAPGARRPHSG